MQRISARSQLPATVNSVDDGASITVVVDLNG